MRFLLLIGVVTWYVTSSNAMAPLAAGTNDEALNAVTRSANAFSSSFFKTVRNDVSGNLICSPISASIVLSMAAYGARENTANQLRTVLALPENDTLAQSGFQAFVDSFGNYKQVELRLANKMFLGKTFEPKPEFRALTETAFRSAVQNVDFENSVEASKTINDWCELQTNNRIKDLMKPDDLNADTALVLVNAVYFKGNWANKFDTAETEPRPFHVNGTTQKDVPTMYRYGSYNYGELPEVKATFIELPYKSDGENDSMSMFIILPDDVNGLAELEKNIDKVTMDKLLRGNSRDVHLYLPKFKIESEIQLKEPLRKMGLTDMFEPYVADFTGIVNAPPLVVTKIVQKAFIEVNEEGSEAAAATGMIFMLRGPAPPKPPSVEFRVDRPAYVCIIAAKSVALFTARLTSP